MIKSQARVAFISRDGLHGCLRGIPPVNVRAIDSPSEITKLKLSSGEALVIYWSDSSRVQHVRPDAIVVREDEKIDLLSWVNNYLTDVAPLSPWCRVLTAELLSPLDSTHRCAELGNLAPAWAGAAIGEALVYGATGLADLTLPTCVATDTFAFARMNALWPQTARTETVNQKLNTARRLLRSPERRFSDRLPTVWAILQAIEENAVQPALAATRSALPILAACRDIRMLGRIRDATAEELLPFPRTPLASFNELSAEDRVRVITGLLSTAKNAVERNDRLMIERLEFVVAYAVAMVGGGSANLDLLSPFLEALPLSFVWCPAIAALNDPLPWGTALGGLGRLVVRELIRPLLIDQLPFCDISLDELSVLAATEVPLRRMRFRTSMARSTYVELAPGVVANVPFQVERNPRDDRAHSQEPESSRGASDWRDLDTMAFAEYFREILDHYLNTASRRRTGADRPSDGPRVRKKSASNKERGLFSKRDTS